MLDNAQCWSELRSMLLRSGFEKDLPHEILAVTFASHPPLCHNSEVRLPDPTARLRVPCLCDKPVHLRDVAVPGMYAGITSPYLNRGLQGPSADASASPV